MKIWQKLIVAFGTTSFLLGVITILLIRFDNHNKIQTSQIREETVEEAKSTSQILKSIQKIQESNQDLIFLNVRDLKKDKILEKYYSNIEFELKKIEEKIEIVKELNSKQKTTINSTKQEKIQDKKEDSYQIDPLLKQIEDYKNKWNIWAEGIKNNPENFSPIEVQSLINQINKEVFPLVVNYHEESLKKIAKSELNIQNSTHTKIITIENYVLFTLMLTLTLFIYIYRSIYSPIKYLKLATAQLRHNFAEYQPLEPENSHDELGNLVEYFNETMERLKTEIISKSYFDNIINSINQGLMIINNEGKIEILNHDMVKILGYSKSELIGKSIDKFVAKSNNFQTKELLELGGICSRSIPVELIKKDRDSILLKVYFYDLLDVQNNKKGTIFLCMQSENSDSKEIITLGESRQ